MTSDGFPAWTMLPFPALVLAIAGLPIVAPRAWEHRWFQGLIVAACATPVLAEEFVSGRGHPIAAAASAYVAFIATLFALYVASGGIHLSGDVEATPSTNVGLLLVGSILASVIGTTGASMLMIRPLLRTNRQRKHRAHLVPFFILAVANAGGLLTPLGDPPLLVGYVGGVPFFWTLRLLPAWMLYVGWLALALYMAERRAYAREDASTLARDGAELEPLRIAGKRNFVLLLAIIPAALLPSGFREATLLAIAFVSYAITSREVHRAAGFSFAPMIDVAIAFAGLFACLGPIDAGLVRAAPSLPVHESWQLFWVSGLLSSILDNAPTYTAFAALARGLNPSLEGAVAGIAPSKLAAISLGTVVMGATTYIGNGPNLMIKAIADRNNFPMPSFFRFARFAFIVMLPAHALVTLVLIALDRG